jgi:hypothetical protein
MERLYGMWEAKERRDIIRAALLNELRELKSLPDRIRQLLEAETRATADLRRSYDLITAVEEKRAA